MKKDKYGTIIGPSRKAPYGYGLCEGCQRPNIHLNYRGQISEHYLLATSEPCPGSLSAPSNVGGKAIYLLITNQAADRSRPIYHERFCFLATSEENAKSDASKWMRHHSMDPRDAHVRLIPPGQARGEDMHDEWIPR